MQLQYLLELGKFPLANKLLVKDYSLKAASAACSLGLNAQNSSEEKMLGKKEVGNAEIVPWWHFQMPV